MGQRSSTCFSVESLHDYNLLFKSAQGIEWNNKLRVLFKDLQSGGGEQRSKDKGLSQHR